MVSLLSEVFVTTQGGNFPHFLMGHRRFIYGGHAKTIKPDKRKLAILMDDRIKLRYSPMRFKLLLLTCLLKGTFRLGYWLCWFWLCIDTNHGNCIAFYSKAFVAINIDNFISCQFYSWKEFKEQMGVLLLESDQKGLMVPRLRRFNRKTSVYTYPLPECRCLQKSHNTNTTDNKYMLDQVFRSMR